jgi:hypothetical protein
VGHVDEHNAVVVDTLAGDQRGRRTLLMPSRLTYLGVYRTAPKGGYVEHAEHAEPIRPSSTRYLIFHHDAHGGFRRPCGIIVPTTPTASGLGHAPPNRKVASRGGAR